MGPKRDGSDVLMNPLPFSALPFEDVDEVDAFRVRERHIADRGLEGSIFCC